MIMIGDALGVRPEDRAELLRWSDDMLKGLATEATEEQTVTAAKAFGEYHAYAAEVIADRQAEPQDDLMSILVHAEVDGDRLSDDEVLQESLLILIGGDETTRHVISGGIHQLLLHPDQWERLADGPRRAARRRSRRCSAGCHPSRTWCAPRRATSSCAASRSTRATS